MGNRKSARCQAALLGPAERCAGCAPDRAVMRLPNQTPVSAYQMIENAPRFTLRREWWGDAWAARVGGGAAVGLCWLRQWGGGGAGREAKEEAVS